MIGIAYGVIFKIQSLDLVPLQYLQFYSSVLINKNILLIHFKHNLLEKETSSYNLDP